MTHNVEANNISARMSCLGRFATKSNKHIADMPHFDMNAFLGPSLHKGKGKGKGKGKDKGKGFSQLLGFGRHFTSLWVEPEEWGGICPAMLFRGCSFSLILFFSFFFFFFVLLVLASSSLLLYSHLLFSCSRVKLLSSRMLV